MIGPIIILGCGAGSVDMLARALRERAVVVIVADVHLDAFESRRLVEKLHRELGSLRVIECSSNVEVPPVDLAKLAALVKYEPPIEEDFSAPRRFALTPVQSPKTITACAGAVVARRLRRIPDT